MKVFITRTGPAFHRSPTCMRVADGRMYAVDPLTIFTRRPCHHCFPDAPVQLDTRKEYCHQCSSARPCRHNGGIRLILKRPTKSGSVREEQRWIWPDSPQTLVREARLVVE